MIGEETLLPMEMIGQEVILPMEMIGQETILPTKLKGMKIPRTGDASNAMGCGHEGQMAIGDEL
jgi:hypothetical protein